MSGSDGVRAEAGRQFAARAALATTMGEGFADAVAEIATRVLRSLERGGRLYFCGNGGSAADAQHLAAEYVVRFGRNRRALPAVALTTDTSVLTAGGNDLGFDAVFARQVEALCGPDDLLILHSTSGASENLLRAADAARAKGPTVSRAGEVLELLGACVAREKAQTRFYRSLAERAEEAGDHALAERANALLADEQHHVSRLTARILELGGRVEGEGATEGFENEAPPVGAWEDVARRREDREVAWYERMIESLADEPARRIVEEILHSERQHARKLGGKWMAAGARAAEESSGEDAPNAPRATRDPNGA